MVVGFRLEGGWCSGRATLAEMAPAAAAGVAAAPLSSVAAGAGGRRGADSESKEKG